MKKTKLAYFLLPFVLLACSGEEQQTLEPGSDLYEFVESLALKVPSLAPDKNMVVVQCDDFELTVHELIIELYKTAGHQLYFLRNEPASRIKQRIEQGALNLADRKLLLKQAEAASIKVSGAEVDSLLEIRSARFGGKEQFQQILAKNDISADNLHEQLAASLTVQRFLEKKLNQEIEVSDEELRAAYEADQTASVRHILLSTQGQDEAEKAKTRTKIEELLRRARNGEDFAELARKYTDDPGSRKNGGLYENFGRGKMVPAFEKASFTVPVGEISDVIETQFGFHIVKVIDRKSETRPFEEVCEELAEKLKRSKFNQLQQAYIESLRQQAGVKIADL